MQRRGVLNVVTVIVVIVNAHKVNIDYEQKMVITKKGDGGKTEVGGEVVDKSSQIVCVLGSIDELNCFLGWLKVESKDKSIIKIQRDMWLISGYLACKSEIDLTKRIEWLENKIKVGEKKLPALKKFLVPGLNKQEAICQICRSVSRRVERCVWKLNKCTKVDKSVLIYFNRLSDYLFMLTRRLT